MGSIKYICPCHFFSFVCFFVFFFACCCHSFLSPLTCGCCFLVTGHLHLKGSTEKMSKSLKNYITIKVKPLCFIPSSLTECSHTLCLTSMSFFLRQDFLQSYSADEFRMFCLLSKYRSGVNVWLFFLNSDVNETQTVDGNNQIKQM